MEKEEQKRESVAATVSERATSLHGHVSGNLLHPPLVRVNGNAGDVHPAALKMDEKQHVTSPRSVSTSAVKKCVERIIQKSKVGDAGYGPAPAVGRGTSLAAVAAYVLALELAEADGDYSSRSGSVNSWRRWYLLCPARSSNGFRCCPERLVARCVPSPRFH